MARKAYIGVNGVARKIKNGYIGVNSVQEVKDANALLLLHGEALKDSSMYGASVTNSGVSVSATQSKFGGSSLYFNGSSRLRAGGTDILNGGQFTIDWWEYRTSDSANYNTVFHQQYTAGSTYGFVVGNSKGGQISVYLSSPGSSTWDLISAWKMGTPVLNQWVHRALVHDGSTLYAFENGTLVNSMAFSRTLALAIAPIIGQQDTSAYFTGYIDEFRISNIARWTANFTPPTAEYDIVTGRIEGSYARRIKKAYIGIGGVARPCWGLGELTYYGTVTGLSVARNALAATTVGNYALFGGGIYFNTVDAYDKSLTRTTATSLSAARGSLAAVSIGDYALFGGGDSGSTRYSNVDAYDKSLTRTAATALSAARTLPAATTVGNYALFNGGYTGTTSTAVDAYDKSLTRTIPTVASVGRYYHTATNVGNYALFGGGGPSEMAVVNAYDTFLTRTIPTELSVSRMVLAATSVGGYALFGGGGRSADTAFYTTVDAYDASLTRTTPVALGVARAGLSAVTLGNYALFGGGGNKSTVLATTDAFDEALTRTSTSNLSQSRTKLAAASVGDYALFAGGYNASSTAYDTVDAYALI